MPTLQAEVQTDRASRYLVQFCKHAAAMGDRGHTSRMHLHTMMARREVQVAAEWSETSGTVTFTPWGRATLTADDGTLTVRIDSADEGDLGQMRDLITRNLERFSRRNPLAITWQRLDPAGAAPVRPLARVTSKPWPGFPRSQTILLAVAAVVVIGLHVGLAGAVLAQSRWTGMAVNVVVALVVVKVALVALARIGFRRHRTRNMPDRD
ncbi:DUF2218 domain-containing protein [Micromonospora yasonensis]|uniref:DUF2218 domain-containing protein n=1 Tax=Micromonospora yasonensis TaxID=1128667 RepID=UPI00222E21B4|nr:DUF2218 domain-containing protein [Micromonospora yasonensis]MCW3845268.1 DUF2218 domain-containing protein [Micromonospora yasonensis]